MLKREPATPSSGYRRIASRCASATEVKCADGCGVKAGTDGANGVVDGGLGAAIARGVGVGVERVGEGVEGELVFGVSEHLDCAQPITNAIMISRTHPVPA